jgi:hypothetical protein
MRRRWLEVVACALLAAVVVSGCGEEDPSYSDKDIIDKLKLEETDDGYAIKGDPFCEVESKLLNDAVEVEEASGGHNGNLVLTSRAGNVGVKARPGFAPDCAKDVRKKLNKLDPPPKDE